MSFTVERIDHVVINCRDLETTVAWYQRVLGMRREEFAYGGHTHTALRFGNQKFNVRPTGTAHWWSVENDAPGALDLCFVTRTPIDEVVRHLQDCGVGIANGPVQRTGAMGPMTSVYFHDPTATSSRSRCIRDQPAAADTYLRRLHEPFAGVILRSIIPANLTLHVQSAGKRPTSSPRPVRRRCASR